jgi:hypothetical protein
MLSNTSVHQGRRAIRKVKELMSYFMLSKIAFSGYEEGACGPDNGSMSVREGPLLRAPEEMTAVQGN